MKNFGKATGAAIDQFSATGNLPLDSDHVRQQFVRAMAPKTIYRSVQAISDATLRSLGTDYPQFNDLKAWERLAYTFSFNPRRIDLGYALQEKLWADQTARRDATAAAGEAMAEAQEAGAWHEVHSIMERAMLQGLPMDSVAASAKTRLARGAEDVISRQFDAEAQLAAQRMGLY